MPAPHDTPAGLVSRVAALTIDLILVAAAAAATRRLPEAVWEQVTDRPSPGWLTFIVSLAAALLPWVYFTGCWWLTGQTIGDLIFGIRVRGRDDGDVGVIRAALRAAFGLALAPLWIIGMLAILWDRRRRAWHDLVFRTEVRYTARTRTAVPA